MYKKNILFLLSNYDKDQFNTTALRHLKTYTLKPFKNLQVGKERVRKFAEFHIIALQTAAIVAFNFLLEDLLAVYTEIFGNIKDRDKLEADRQSATKQLNASFEAFKTKALEIEPLVKYKLTPLG